MLTVKYILEENKNRLITVPIDATVGEAVLLMKEEHVGAPTDTDRFPFSSGRGRAAHGVSSVSPMMRPPRLSFM